MRDWKKISINLVVALLLILMGVEFCMELRYPCSEAAVASNNTEAILRRVPEVEITEAEMAMLEEFSRYAVVQELLESGESGYLSAAEEPELMSAADRYLPLESAAAVVVNGIFYEESSFLNVNWEDGDGHRVFLEKVRDGSEENYYKLYSVSRRTFYENWDNERAQKNVVRRRWLAWLRD